MQTSACGQINPWLAWLSVSKVAYATCFAWLQCSPVPLVLESIGSYWGAGIWGVEMDRLGRVLAAIISNCLSFLCWQPRKTLMCFVMPRLVSRVGCIGIWWWRQVGGFPFQHLQKKLSWHLPAEQLWCCRSCKWRALWHVWVIFAHSFLIHNQQLYSSLITRLQANQNLVCSPVWSRLWIVLQ